MSTVNERKYLVVTGGGFTRDTQFYVKRLTDYENVDFHDDEAGWIDFVGASVLGVYIAESKENAINKASRENGIHYENLDAYELA